MMLYSATADVAEYVSRCRDINRFAGCCRQCAAYGRFWACPPYEADVEGMIDGFTHVTLVAVRIEDYARGAAVSESQAILLPYRRRLQRLLLDTEAAIDSPALALSFAGQCIYCPDGECTRPQGMPCRHPDLVRPSLESLGFDVTESARHYLGLEIIWGSKGVLPPYLVLASALFHCSPDGAASFFLNNWPASSR